MAYQFPPDLEVEVNERMKSGQYATEDDLLREALSVLKWRDGEVAAIQEGIEKLDLGKIHFVDTDGNVVE